MNPLHLLKLEWSKYYPSGTFRVFIILYVVSFALVVFAARSIGHGMTVDMNGQTVHPMEQMLNYPQNWQIIASIGNWMNLFVLGLLGVFMITLEFANRTLRQSVAFGLTRLEVAAAKLVWAVAIALAATLFYLFLAFGEEVLDGSGFGLPPVTCVVGFFLQAVGYLFLGNLVGLFIRQTALAVLMYLAYTAFLETVFRWIFYFAVSKTKLLLFLPGHVLGSLTPLPLPSEASSFGPSLSTLEVTLSALAYLGLFGALFCRRIIKADL